MDSTQTFRSAVSLLRSIPNWEELQQTYGGGLDEHFQDIEDDLTRFPKIENLTD